MKAYSARSSAVRAAKSQFGAEWETKAAVMLAADNKGFVIISKAPEKAPEAPAPEAKADGHMSLSEALIESGEALSDLVDEEVIAGLSHCPSCEIHLSNGVGHHGQEVNGAYMKHKAFQYECLGCGHEFGPAIKAKAPKAPSAPADRTDWQLSTAIKPTKLVHIIAAGMPDASRKEVIDACIAAGIGAGTARTQYQAYFSARKADEARQAAMGEGK